MVYSFCARKQQVRGRRHLPPFTVHFQHCTVLYDYPDFCVTTLHIHSRVKDIINHDPHSPLNLIKWTERSVDLPS